MTEQEWLTSSDVLKMANLISRWQGTSRRKVGRRKLRLFGCACCRQFWELMTDPRSRHAVETAERLADALATQAEANEGHKQALEALRDLEERRWGERYRETGRAHGWLESDEFIALQGACMVLDVQIGGSTYATLGYSYSNGSSEYPIYAKRRRWEADALRCLFGNPFRPVTMQPGWRTEATQAIAAGIYAERGFAQLPVLADALLDAGCSDPQVLEHCRGGGVHVRGCWVVDLLLEKQ
jgi:hypothetical protein